MKKSVVIFITAVCLLITGCGSTGSLSKLPSSSFHEDKQKLTIMHIDADNKRFQDFIEETEKKLDMEITVEKCPSNADNRQAKISTILASGDKNIDLISVNDEMISEFKHKGYLEPLEKNVMTEEVRDSFPQEYLESICEENGHIYSVPFQMDIMMFWVNQELLKQAGLDEIKDTGDFDILQKSLKNSDQYAYGDAWENTHVYNSLAQCYAQTIREIEEMSEITYESIHVVGGGANAAYLNELTAKATGKTVYAGPTEATAIGNLMAQIIAAGELENLQAARKCIFESFEIKKYEK